MARTAHEGDNAVHQITGGDHENADAPSTGSLTPDELKAHAKATSGIPRLNPVTGEATIGGPVNRNPNRPVIPPGVPFALNNTLTDKELPFIMTPSLDERLVDGIEDSEEFAGYLAPAKHCLSHAAESLKLLDEAYRALSKDTSLTATGKMLRLEPGASKAMESIAKTFDKAIKNLTTEVANIEKQLSAPVVSTSMSAAAQEMRTVLRGMSEKDRNAAIDKAVNEGDDHIIVAVLGSHPLASGVDALRHQDWNRKIREKRQPDLLRRKKATERAIEVLHRAAPTVFEMVEKAARFRYRDIKGLKEKADNSAAALAKLGSFPVHHD